MTRHVLRTAVVLWLHVAIRAALESAVQLGRGDEVSEVNKSEVNREAEMAQTAKCRDSLQTKRHGPALAARRNYA
jgi:hypothetical protein